MSEWKCWVCPYSVATMLERNAHMRVSHPEEWSKYDNPHTTTNEQELK